MTVTEYAILPFKSSPSPSDPVLHALFEQLSTWQSECSGFPLRFYTHRAAPREVCLVTGWKSVEAHEAWIRGEKNQELLRVFGPYVDIPKVRMVHVDVDFEAMGRDGGCTDEVVIVERYDDEHWEEISPARERSGMCVWELIGRDLARNEGDVYRFIGATGDGVVDPVGEGPIESWVLNRIEL